MKKIILACLLLVSATLSVSAQTYKTRDGNIYFNPNKNQNDKEYAALSKEATAIFKVETSEVALLVPMKSFHFNNALLEEHFNENYLHTNKYPNGTYKGKLIGFDKSMLSKDGEYKIGSEGKVELHGVTKEFKAPVTLTVKNNVATFSCQFTIRADDFNIEIPSLVKPKLAEATPLSATISFKMN
jgi:polyisoprenoid-binding protein YceI